MHEILIDKLPPKLMSQMAFFDQWQDPVAFYEITRDQRLKLRQSLLGQSTKATQSNYWIWFGAYDAKRGPIFNTRRVPRQIYLAIHDRVPLDQNGREKRLVNTIVESYSDVNINKYMFSTGQRLEQRIKSFEEQLGIEVTPEMNPRRQVNRGLETLYENLDNMTEPDEWALVLKVMCKINNSNTIETIIKLFEEKYHDQIKQSRAERNS